MRYSPDDELVETLQGEPPRAESHGWGDLSRLYRLPRRTAAPARWRLAGRTGRSRPMCPDAARRSWSCTSCSTRLGRACRIPASASARRSRSGTAVRTRWGSVSEGSGDQVSGAGGQPGQGRLGSLAPYAWMGRTSSTGQTSLHRAVRSRPEPTHAQAPCGERIRISSTSPVSLARWTVWADRSMTTHTASSMATPHPSAR